MRYTLKLSIVLAVCALLAAPALAAPAAQRVTWRGSGVSADHPVLTNEIIGDPVRFSVVATEVMPGDWRGGGTFVDRSRNLKADLVIVTGEPLLDGTMLFTGDADVTAGGVRYTTGSFELTLDRATSACQLLIDHDLEHVWIWWLPGPSFKGSARVP